VKGLSLSDMRYWPRSKHNTTSLQWLEFKPFAHPMDTQSTMESSKDFYRISLDEVKEFRMRFIKGKEAEHCPQLCHVETGN
jgi:hypothetical protein